MITKECFDTVVKYDSYYQYKDAQKLKTMTPLNMVTDFMGSMGQPLHQKFYDPERIEGNSDWLIASKYALIEEEFEEFSEYSMTEEEDILKELADLVYVCYGYAATFGWDLDEAFRRVHKSNMSKLDPVTGEPLKREDGKVLKGPYYKKPDLKDLV